MSKIQMTNSIEQFEYGVRCGNFPYWNVLYCICDDAYFICVHAYVGVRAYKQENLCTLNCYN